MKLEGAALNSSAFLLSGWMWVAWREQEGVRPLVRMLLRRPGIAGHVCRMIPGMADTTGDSRRELRKSLNLE